MDPRDVLEGRAGNGINSSGSSGTTATRTSGRVRLSVPAALVPHLSNGARTLGDADEPLDEWAFGARARELFDYRLVGAARTRSGYAAIMTAGALAAFAGAASPASSNTPQQQQQQPAAPAWDKFKAALVAGSVKFPSKKHPFLWAGPILESAEAAVYVYRGSDGKPAGVLLSSEAGGVGV